MALVRIPAFRRYLDMRTSARTSSEVDKIVTQAGAVPNRSGFNSYTNLEFMSRVIAQMANFL